MKKYKIAFATHAYYKDWRVVLNPKRFEEIVKSHKYDFERIVIIINNINNKSEKRKAISAAEILLEKGIATDVLISDEYLTKDVLSYFNIDYNFFWKNNPYFSTAQLSALHYLRNKADFVLHMSGDVWLEKCGEWISGALAGLERDDDMLGFNLCRNIYIDKYPIWAIEENDKFWISYGKLSENEEKRGFGLSDHAYIIKTNPKIDYDFGFDLKELEGYNAYWPSYARPCFEMYIRAFLDRKKLKYGALKPQNGLPITKHKNFSNSKIKSLFYLLAGYYTNGKYSTICS
ncbi:hypothetical protein [Nitratifractor sp.]